MTSRAKAGYVVSEICACTDRQTDRDADYNTSEPVRSRDVPLDRCLDTAVQHRRQAAELAG